jgi:hypothetical protein
MRLLWCAHSHAEHVRVLDHWMALPEDLRSALLRTYGRDELANYHRALLDAVEIWQHAGAWRVSSIARGK